MTATARGIIRRFDDLGRIVIPKEIRRKFKINAGEPVEIYITEEGILLKPHNPKPKSNTELARMKREEKEYFE